MKTWISVPRREGTASRQAHADLPQGTYEREIGKEGFFGPATQMYHRHPPTGWVEWDGPLKPRAFDLAKLNAVQSSPWDAMIACCSSAIFCPGRAVAAIWKEPASAMPDCAHASRSAPGKRGSSAVAAARKSSGSDAP
mgnify:CR=1 FL=1